MKDLFTHSMLVVPNKQMEDFMFIMDLNPDGVSFDSEPFAIGNKVKVIKGDFSGIEGEIATQANKVLSEANQLILSKFSSSREEESP